MGQVYGAKHKGFTAGWYDTNMRKPEICLTYWEKGRREIDAIKFDWYFYLTDEDANKVIGARFFDNLTDDVRPTKDGRFARVYMPYYGDDRKDLIKWLVSKGIEPLEGDVNPLGRFMFDNKVKINPDPRVLFYDLETDPRTGFGDIPGHRILSVAYGHNPDDIECLIAASDNDKGEEELLNAFLDVVVDNDTLIAWNSKVYDEIVTKARVRRLGLRVNWQMVNFLDYMLLFKRYYQRDEAGAGVKVSYALDNICEKCLGKGKVDIGIEKHKMIELWRNNKPLLEKYNKVDVLRIYQLEEKFHYIKAHAIMAQVCNRFLSDRALKAGYLIDGFVLRYATLNGVRFPTKHYKDSDELPEKIEGAWVMEPVPGLHEGVCDLDFSSLYPSVIRAFNISPEVRVPEAEIEAIERATGDDLANHGYSVAASGAVFKTEPEGVFPAIVTLAVQGRDKFKKTALRLEEDGKENSAEHREAFQRSLVWKQLANALCLGTMASSYSRYYDRESGQALTTSAKMLEESVVKLADELGIPTIYGDTDSGFMRCTKKVGKEFIPRAEEHVDKLLDLRGAATGLLKLKLDAYFLRLVFTGKKHYVGKKDTGVWDIRGIELVRSDGCRYTRELQRRILELMLEARTPTPQKAEKIIRKWADRLFSGELPVEELVMAQSLGQPIDDYAKTKAGEPQQVHARVAKEMLASGKEVFEHMKIPYVFVGKDREGNLKAVHAEDFDGHYDPVHYWNRVYPASQRFLMSAWPREEGLWDALEKYNPKAPQKELFSVSESATGPSVSVFRLKESDREHMESLRAIMDKYPGPHPVVLCLQLDDGSEMDLKTACKVRHVPELIKELEALVDHRLHYEKEEWDNGKSCG